MIKTIKIALLILILSYGCTHKNNPQDQTIKISGKITNLESDEITLFQSGDITSVKTDDEGNFNLVFEGDEGSNYVVYSGRTHFELYLSQGDSIYITADAKDFSNTFDIHGDHDKENKYLFEKAQIDYESGLNNLMEIMSHSKEKYFHTKDSLFTLSKVAFDKYKKQENIDPEFILNEEAYFTYTPLWYDLNYPNYHASLTNISLESIEFPVDETNSKLAAIPLDQKHLLRASSYTTLVDIRVSNLTHEIIKSDSTLMSDDRAYDKVRVMVIDSLIKDKTVNDHFIYLTIMSNMEYRGPEYVRESYEKFINENKSPKYAEKLEKLKNKWEPISYGKNVPDFTFTSIEGKEVKLSDLKGNLIYIDIWATWCGPCIAEHPHWDKLKGEYVDKSIAFLSVSIDDSEESWKKMVKAKNMDGLQWFAKNAWKSDLSHHFMVNSIPRFILINEEGKIIDPATDRPSGAIRETLDKYLAKKDS